MPLAHHFVKKCGGGGRCVEARYVSLDRQANAHIASFLDQPVNAFAFVADGKNGLRVLQILSPWDDPAHFSGFSPRPTPKLIATAHTRGPAVAISKGIDRDRAVDESGNQLAVFGRRGARPLNRAEAQRLYLHPRTSEFYSVEGEPAGASRSGSGAAASDSGSLESFVARARNWLRTFY